MASPFDDQAFPYVIDVLEGDFVHRNIQVGQPDGRLSLTGRMLPYQGVKYGGKQRIKTTFYPGNPQGTQQVFGPTESPTTIRGTWKDRYLGDGASRRLMNLVDAIRRQGPRLQVGWGATSNGEDAFGSFSVGDSIVRFGLISQAYFTFDVPQECAWEIEFEWSGAGDAAVSPVFSSPVVNPREGLDAVGDDVMNTAALVESFIDLRNNKYASMGLREIRALQDAVDQLNEVFTGINTASASIQGVVSLQPQLIGGLLASLGYGVASTTALIEQLESLDFSTLVPFDDPLELLELRGDVLALLHAAHVTRESCTNQSNSMRTLVIPDLLDEVRVPAGTDLRQLADQYGVDWTEIQAANGFTGSFVPMPPTGPSDRTGAPVKIPRPGLNTGLKAGC